MKALVYHGPGAKAWENFPMPTLLEDTDAIVQVDTTTICGTDPPILELAVDLVRPGGHVANIGVHGTSATLHLERIWARNLTITTGLVDTYSTPTLLRLLTGRQVDADRFVTHHFGFDEFDTAYDVFSRAGETGALKVVLSK